MTRYIPLFLVLTALVASGALAQSTNDTVNIRVRFDDLNLSSPAGVDTLRRRVRTAALSVCGSAPRVADLTRFSLYQQCVRDAEGSASAQVANAVAMAPSHLARR